MGKTAIIHSGFWQYKNTATVHFIRKNSPTTGMSKPTRFRLGYPQAAKNHSSVTGPITTHTHRRPLGEQLSQSCPNRQGRTES